jgi:hypothetical protein
MSDGLLSALLAFQHEAPKLRKAGENPHFRSRFVTLDTIVETVGPLLNKHGLVWTTLPGRDSTGEPALHYRLAHASTGEALDGCIPLLLTKADPQGQGSALTYARRYSITAVLNLVADEDDDGNSASTPRPAAHPFQAGRPEPVAAPANGTERIANAKQRGLIFARADEKNMPSSLLANVVLVAMDKEPREFDSEDAARAWLKRALDRLPAARVDAVLKNIEAEVAA